jgi:restriction system protein
VAGRSSFFDDIAKLPWQVGVILAVLCYPGAVLLKSYFASNPVLTGFGIAVSTVWPIFSALFLVAAFASFVSDRNKFSIFKSHRSIEKIRTLNWQQFEQFVGSYFKDHGYSVVETVAGPDGGMDLVLRKDGGKTYVQCKHWKTYNVGVEKVRELFGSMATLRFLLQVDCSFLLNISCNVFLT